MIILKVLITIVIFLNYTALSYKLIKKREIDQTNSVKGMHLWSLHKKYTQGVVGLIIISCKKIMFANDSYCTLYMYVLIMSFSSALLY